MKRLTAQQIRAFRRLVYSHFSRHGRNLPWRKTADPYRILISEVMLQQTQVDRVIPKYKEFLKAFPTVRKLAHAPLSNVLWMWSGLGYNRRAASLKRCAEQIVMEYAGKFPDTFEELDALPGIGYYTAGAVLAFAYNKPVVFIETNIRSVYLHHFFRRKESVHDNELLPLIAQTLDRRNPRRWYGALMDYGSVLKKQTPNPSRRSKHHSVQSRFQGSNRQARGLVLRKLLRRRMTLAQLNRTVNLEPTRVQHALRELMQEGILVKKQRHFEVI